VAYDRGAKEDADMAQVVHLKASEPLPEEGEFLVVTRLSRLRAYEFFIDVSPALEPKVGARVPPGEPGYPTQEKSIEAAQDLAGRHGVPKIYVQHHSIIVRPFYPGEEPV